MNGILVAGTSSDAGKSLVVAGLCRALARRGVRVAPFKAQNMSNNSAVCADGSEIGRAQYLQAQAAGIEPTSLLNPVLLKPGTDRRSHVVVRGRPAGTLEAGEYATGRGHLAEAAFAAYRELTAEHDVVVVEGAGSPAEVNLRERDYVNMGLAREFSLPVVVVGDIDRGGVLASLYGTWAMLERTDRSLLAGYVVNKFRGDRGLLEPGLAAVTRRTGLPCLGVLPWLPDVWIDGEDALDVARWAPATAAETGQQGQPGSVDADPGSGPLRVAVVGLPRISNTTDVEALVRTPGVHVEVTTDPVVCAASDLLVLPGTRATVDDLAWLHERGIADVVARRHATGRPTLGLCGGYQMLAGSITDDVEARVGTVPGLGLLPVTVEFGAKVTARTSHAWRGLDVPGYEIRHGAVTVAGPAEEFLDGCRLGATFGTLLHGAFEHQPFTDAFLTEMAALAGRAWTPSPHPTHAEAREAMLETLADALEEHVDVDRLLEVMRPTHQVGSDPEGTTRTRRKQPRLIVNTGHGKGKSSSAFGTGLRSWAQGWSIGVFQFLKSDKWRTGERAAYEALARQHAATGEGGPVEWHTMGAGWTWLRSTADVDQVELARQGWAEIARRLAEQRHDLYILDEFTYALARGWVDLDEVLATLAARPGMQHVIITGRDAPPALLDAADLATEMDKVKHPFDTGARGQAGIEW